MTRRRLALLLLACALGCATPALAIDADEPLPDPDRQALYKRLTHEVRCLVCQNQTLADSTAPLAADLRRELRELVAAGRSEDEIKRFLTERYGDFVLYRPRFSARNALLWLAPALLLAGGLAWLYRIVRRRAALPLDDDEEAGGVT